MSKTLLTINPHNTSFSAANTKSTSQLLETLSPRRRLENENKYKEVLSNEIPQGSVLGSAYSQGDCFFDALAQIINQLNKTNVNTDKYLRRLCHDFYLKNKTLVDRWNAGDFGGIDSRKDEYHLVQYTFDECEELFHGRTPIWGRPNVEGKILCHQLNLEAICVIEILEDPQTKQPIVSFHIVNKDFYKSISNEEAQEWLKNPRIPTVVVEQNSLHFVPVLVEQNSIISAMHPELLTRLELEEYRAGDNITFNGLEDCLDALSTAKTIDELSTKLKTYTLRIWQRSRDTEGTLELVHITKSPIDENAVDILVDSCKFLPSNSDKVEMDLKERRRLENENKYKEVLSNEIPQGSVLGSAYSQGDCFFDALAQIINQLNKTNVNTDKYLRRLCHDFYLDNKALVDSWNQSELGGTDGRKDEYYFVQYTVDECEKHFHGRSPIWGRPNIEGRILCEKLNLEAICVVEVFEDTQSKKSLRNFHLVTRSGYTNISGEEAYWWLNNPKIPSMVVERASLQFVPILVEQNSIVPVAQTGVKFVLLLPASHYTKASFLRDKIYNLIKTAHIKKSLELHKSLVHLYGDMTAYICRIGSEDYISDFVSDHVTIMCQLFQLRNDIILVNAEKAFEDTIKISFLPDQQKEPLDERIKSIVQKHNAASAKKEKDKTEFYGDLAGFGLGIAIAAVAAVGSPIGWAVAVGLAANAARIKINQWRREQQNKKTTEFLNKHFEKLVTTAQNIFDYLEGKMTFFETTRRTNEIISTIEKECLEITNQQYLYLQDKGALTPEEKELLKNLREIVNEDPKQQPIISEQEKLILEKYDYDVSTLNPEDIQAILESIREEQLTVSSESHLSNDVPALPTPYCGR